MRYFEISTNHTTVTTAHTDCVLLSIGTLEVTIYYVSHVTTFIDDLLSPLTITLKFFTRKVRHSSAKYLKLLVDKREKN